MADSPKISVTSKATGQTKFVDKPNTRPSGTSASTPDTAGPSAGSNQSGASPLGTPVAAGSEVREVEKSSSKRNERARKEIENLEQFIEFAYSRRGQRVTLKSKVERGLSQQPKLVPEARERLLEKARKDILLVVPRQLLLVARDVVGFPGLKAEIRGFVGEVLKNHPIFSSKELRATINNLPDAPRIGQALAIIAGSDLTSLPVRAGKSSQSVTDLSELRRNAIYCLAVWCSETRGLSPDDISETLLSTLWEPEASRVTDDSTRLRLLTEIRDLAGVGLACAALKAEAEKQLRITQDARRSESSALEKMRVLEESSTKLQQKIEGKDEKIAALIQQTQEQDSSHQQAIAHVRDDYEKLRGRLLRRLKADVTLLEEGLHALRRDPPKVRVMDDHAERALEGLRAEIRQLESGE
jgi:hypothetical protein